MEKPAGSYSIAECKARLSGLVRRVERGRETVVVTKRGRPVARIVPVVRARRRSLKGSLTFHGDIVSPLNEPWEARG